MGIINLTNFSGLQWLLKPLKFLLYAFKTPSSFKESWVKYCYNQVGHAYLVGGFLVIIGTPVEVVFWGYFTWELLQYLYNKNAELWDCVEDFIHVTLIALAVDQKIYWLIFFQILLLIKGVSWRKSLEKINGN